MSGILMLNADARRLPLADGSVHCVVTSPPYFGLRDYGGNDRQIGLEQVHDCLGWARGARLCQGDAAADCYVCTLRGVAREVWRVLRDDGTFWLNIGDSYTSATKGSGGTGASGLRDDGRSRGAMLRAAAHTHAAQMSGSVRKLKTGLRPKSLVGAPWRVALALQADGWILRSDIIWSKPNPMPESVRDRCTKAHEYVFMLAKSPRYYYDADAIREPYVKTGPDHGFIGRQGGARDGVQSGGHGSAVFVQGDGRNKRGVWRVSTQPYAGAHFAVWPPALVEPMILAGCPEGGVVLDPFAGSGTTGMVAAQHRRRAILVDCNRAYLAEQARARTSNIQVNLLSA